jgi:DNA polymerase-3 subunit delta
VLSANDELEAYIESPEPMTTMVFVAGNLDANRRLVKLLRKNATSVNCGVLEGPAEAAAWIQKRLEKDGLAIEPRAVKLVLASTGLSLGRIRAEIDKLALYASGEKGITATHVNDVILPQIEAGEEFALMRAIGYGNAAAALREVAALIDTGMPPFMVLGQIRVATGRLKPDARAKSGLDAVFETDIAIKSSIGEPRYLLERLVIQLCAAR